MQRLSVEYVSGAVHDILVGVGTPGDIARRVTEVLVNANLVGHDSHGIIRIPSYLEEVDGKKVLVGERPEIVGETAATAVMDGRSGWGAYAVDRAMTLAIEKARSTGLGAVALRRCNHAGRLGEYVEMAARAGCVGMVFLGYGGRDFGDCAPYGGKSKALLTNPVAIGAPVAGRAPFVLDYATTVASRGKVKVAQSRGESMPEGWALDSDGFPTTSPDAFFNGGFLSHFGGYKGYGLSLATCLLGGLGGAFNPARSVMGGIYVQAIDVRAFQDADEYGRRAAAFLDAMRGSPAVQPDRPVQVPGDPEAKVRGERSARGIEVPAGVWNQIVAAAAAHGIPLRAPEPDALGDRVAAT
ncbi:dehydrogenase [Sulfurifustis variabilis]|uniref:Dehydrogenase n=1 Tax=Sulfurifustis variabilis TaxID=1675686 RepID=A0A1B4V7I2_9GAMM|nr:Ldh family oxidoreductase [Sulfurifustis variabilis]BAU48562.1 dehydrogenase [Sulfurifustis variabilis]